MNACSVFQRTWSVIKPSHYSRTCEWIMSAMSVWGQVVFRSLHSRARGENFKTHQHTICNRRFSCWRQYLYFPLWVKCQNVYSSNNIQWDARISSLAASRMCVMLTLFRDIRKGSLSFQVNRSEQASEEFHFFLLNINSDRTTSCQSKGLSLLSILDVFTLLPLHLVPSFPSHVLHTHPIIFPNTSHSICETCWDFIIHSR